MQYFLAKSEPGEYSISDLQRDITTIWDGVHNNAAILHIQKMQPGDRVFIYHSQSDKQIVGEAEVIGEPFHNVVDPRRSWAVELRFVRSFQGPTLTEIKSNSLCSDFALVRQSRLSVMPVPDVIASWINSF